MEKSEPEKEKPKPKTSTESKLKPESTPKQTNKVTEDSKKEEKPKEKETEKKVDKVTENSKKDEKPNKKESEKKVDSQTKKADVEKILKKYQELNRRKRIIGSEKSKLEEEDLCYLNFDYSEDYTSRRFIMAQAQIDPSQGAPKENTEYIYVSDNKLKYINKDYKKVQAKIYDHKCDVKLKVADQSFKAHRDVLSEASDYFSAMFRHDMKEKKQDVIEIKDISPKGFAAILDYFYHGHVTIDPDNIEDNIEAARFFHNDWLLEICCDFLVRHLSLENYTAVLQLTDKYWLGDLRWDIFVFLGQNLPELVNQERFFQNLPMELILQFLMENVYVEASENFILDFILKWVQEDPDKRKEHLLPLLRQVKFPVMEAEELESLPDEVMNIPEMKQLVEDAVNYNCNIMGQCLTTGDNYVPRGARKVLAVTSFSDDYNTVAYRDPEKPGLFVEQLGPTGLDTADYHAMMQTSIGNFLYAAGGYDGNYSTTAKVFRFDPKYREWWEVSPMNRPRVSFAICSSDKNVYVFGGVNHQHTEEEEDVEEILSEVEIYDPQENKWDDLASLPTKCFDQAAAYCDGCLFVTGGISADPSDPVPLDNVWCLKINGDDGWVPKQSMNKQRQGHSMTALNGKIYVVGGYTNFSENMDSRDCIDNEVFDMETGQWSKLAPTPENFRHLFRHVAFYEHKIYALGGNNSYTMLYVYDIDSDTWEEKEPIGPNVQKLSFLSVAYPHS